MFLAYWSYWRKFIISALIAGVILFCSLRGPCSLLHIYQVRKQRDQIKKDILQLVEENKILRQQIQRLRSDPELIARLAREELGLVKPGEIVYRYHQLKRETKKAER